MNEARAGADALFILLGAIMVLAMHARLRLPRARHGARRRTRSTRWSRSWSTSPSRPSPTSSSATRSPTASHFFAGAEALAAKNGYELVQVLLPAHLRRRDPGDRLGRHRRARALLAAARGDGGARRPRLSVLRRHRLERQLRHPGLAQGASPAPSSTISPARVVVHAVGGWIGAGRRAAARRAQRPLPQGRRGQRASAVEHSRSSRSAPGCSSSAGSAST